MPLLCESGSICYATTSFGCLDTQPSSRRNATGPANSGNRPSISGREPAREPGVWDSDRSCTSANAKPNQQGGGGGGPGGGGRHAVALAVVDLEAGLTWRPWGWWWRRNGRMFGPARIRGANIPSTFSAQALNLFNDIDYGRQSGSVERLIPGTTHMVPGTGLVSRQVLPTGFSRTGPAARRIFFQADIRVLIVELMQKYERPEHCAPAGLLQASVR